jgi:hypothetical protein
MGEFGGRESRWNGYVRDGGALKILGQFFDDDFG